jgi:hypothetical protein
LVLCLRHVPTLVLAVQQKVGRPCSGLQVSLVSTLTAAWVITNNLSCSAGISIGVGLIRICFPESQTFIEAKKSGKRTMKAGEFWRETRTMLAKEWRMCVYCVILMTWVCYYRYHNPHQRTANLFLNSSTTTPTHPKTRTPHSCSRQKSLITPAPRVLPF